MSFCDFDIPDLDSEQDGNDCATNAPIHTFDGLKKLLSSLGYHINKAEGYKAISVADVTLDEIRSGAIEFLNDGIFVTTDGVKRQVFLYKRDYHLVLHGKPRFHIRKCKTIQSFMSGDGSIPLYRRANTNPVWVRDIDDDRKDKEVYSLPLCKYCLSMAQDAFKGMSTLDFVDLLKKAEDAGPEGNVEVDIFGYTKDWEIISRILREQYEFTCEKCGLKITEPFDQYFIHVHHKNGRKTDNRRSNLQCLCLRCHAEVDENHKYRLTMSGANRLIYSNFEKKYPRSTKN